MTFAERLEFLMRQRGTSKYQLAKAIGCHQSNISYWLSGERSPQYRLKKAVADYFNVSLSWLETGEGSSDVLLITMMENNLVPPIPEGQKEKSPTPEGAELDPVTRELFEIVNGSNEDELKALLEMARLIKKRRDA